VGAIRTYDLAKYYGNVKALDGIDLDIRRVRSSQYSGLTVLVR
jgi:ABC-type sugar transport system ATPase subunit